MVINILFSVSNGYLGTICMMFGAKNLPENEKASGGATLVTFLVVGLAVGSLCSGLVLMLL